MKHKATDDLVRLMTLQERDFTLSEIYKIVCKPPHKAELTTKELHMRTSRSIGGAKLALKKLGYVVVPGELRHSYKAVKRKRASV